MAKIRDEFNRDEFSSILKSNGIYDKSEIECYNKFNRFGCLDPYNRLGITKEYLFFVKPDLHIWEPGTTILNPQLVSNQYFVDLTERYPHVVQSLQRSAGGDSSVTRCPFMTILSNTVKNTLDLEDINAEDIETSPNMFGTKIMYRKHTWSEDENKDFSLEFEDTRYLEIYNLVKAYDEYNRMAAQGKVDAPNLNSAPISGSGYNYNEYIQNRELYDTFGIYKFIVDEDYETIIYYAYLCGVYFKNVPRGSFSDITQGDPLKYTLQFHTFTIEDNNPMILTDFNSLIADSYGNGTSESILTNTSPLPIYDEEKGRVNGDWATCPWITRTYKDKTQPKAWNGIDGMAYNYKLTWRI